MKKPIKIKKPKIVKSEADLVTQYANEIIRRQTTRGQLSKEFEQLGSGKVNKGLWMDGDFFFSVVFQSAEQKYEFLKQWGVQTETPDGQIQIVNGLKLAEKLGIALKPEKALDYPYPDLELKKQVLDDSEF